VIFFAQIVFVEETHAEARKADKKLSRIPAFSFALCQWPIPQIAFHDGKGCAIVSLSPFNGGLGVGKGSRAASSACPFSGRFFRWSRGPGREMPRQAVGSVGCEESDGGVWEFEEKLVIGHGEISRPVQAVGGEE